MFSNNVDGSLDIVKIKTAGSSYTVSGGATSGTITVQWLIRGDGTGGVASVTLTSGAITINDYYNKRIRIYIWLY